MQTATDPGDLGSLADLWREARILRESLMLGGAESVFASVIGDERVVAAARHLTDTCGVDNILVTRSEDGMTLATADGQVEHIAAGIVVGKVGTAAVRTEELLSRARRVCDRLIVGLNADSSVRRLKGPERPVQNESARAAVLSSLASVDLVTLFSEDTPLRLIKAIRPDVLVKGADYTVETVVGADMVHSYGGTVLLAELTPDQSTTRLVHRMRSRPPA